MPLLLEFGKPNYFCYFRVLFFYLIHHMNSPDFEIKLEYDEKRIQKMTEHYKAILELLGEDSEREGLLKTPERVAKAMQYLTKGYAEDPREILRAALFKEDYKQMVLVKDIEMYSLCEHHMLPFIGKAHVAYIPNGTITGLSKIARVVEAFSRRLQVQERLTMQIKDCIQDTLDPLGVAVVIEAKHLCMCMRGVRNQNAITTTSDFTGAFKTQLKTREEFIRLIGTTLL
ncbi:GTP cyclohydrolase I [Balneicella halophila]|uniref:GTP cyclohydrolase 1 n=2 Tax=Balneicella halophila TaxID=1537566 RepID=A0A7L4UNH9_BALHA|nr:GTP cyclohydrolase I [Balneicella halophila]